MSRVTGIIEIGNSKGSRSREKPIKSTRELKRSSSVLTSRWNRKVSKVVGICTHGRGAFIKQCRSPKASSWIGSLKQGRRSSYGESEGELILGGRRSRAEVCCFGVG